MKTYLSKENSLLPIIIICGLCLGSDRYIPNSLLTLPLVIAVMVSTGITYWGIPNLKQLKIKQIIRKEGPKSHYKKQGTPTMGGLLIIPIGLIVGNLASLSNNSNEKLIALNYIILLYMIIGGMDDWQSLRSKTNSGLSPKAKILLQSLFSIIFLFWGGIKGLITSYISLPFGLSIDIGWLIWPLGLFVFLAESNATNLTDGLDGLASSCGALVFAGLALQLTIRGNNGDPVLAAFSIAMAGSLLGFLIFNTQPARVFMGDTGSLAMGAALSGIALLSDSLWALLIMGGVFLAESLSVIIQVLVFKATKGPNGKEGKRLLLMAPLHHHYELSGKNEKTIVKGFWLTTLALVILGIILNPNS